MSETHIKMNFKTLLFYGISVENVYLRSHVKNIDNIIQLFLKNLWRGAAERGQWEKVKTDIQHIRIVIINVVY